MCRLGYQEPREEETVSLNCEEHNHSPIVTEGRSNPVKETAKERIKLLSDGNHRSSCSLRVRSAYCASLMSSIRG